MFPFFNQKNQNTQQCNTKISEIHSGQPIMLKSGVSVTIHISSKQIFQKRRFTEYFNRNCTVPIPQKRTMSPKNLPWSNPQYQFNIMKYTSSFYWIIFFKDFIYLFDRERAQVGRVVDRGRRRSRLPAEQGARCGARSQHPGIMTWAEGRHLTIWATQAPQGDIIFPPDSGNQFRSQTFKFVFLCECHLRGLWLLQIDPEVMCEKWH